MAQHPFVNRVGPGDHGCRTLLSRLSALISPIWDEGLRLTLWWGLLMASTICILELCRWFWLIYPETVVGEKYISGADDLPAFAHTVLHTPHWYTALFLVTVPGAASLTLAWGSRFCYLKRLLYNPFGTILRTFIWATPVAIWTGYYVSSHLELTLEAATTLAAGPSLALIPQAFRTADRLCPELGACLRWLRRRRRQLQRGSAQSKRLNSDRSQRARALFF